jgi:hypothetical protein
MTDGPFSVWEVWPQLPHGQWYSQLGYNRSSSLTELSTVSWNGLSKTPLEGNVLCADKVSRNYTFCRDAADRVVSEFEWGPDGGPQQEEQQGQQDEVAAEPTDL